MNKDFFKLKSAGFTLLEVLVYLAIFSLIFVAVISFASNLFKSYNKMLAKSEISANGQNAMNAILQEIRFAKSIYTPTSIFNSDNGQLSLETQINPPADEISTYSDIYLDNYRVYIKREGQAALPITSEKVRVVSLKFLLYSSGDNFPFVSINLGIENNLPSQLKETLTLQSGATLRGNYE